MSYLIIATLILIILLRESSHHYEMERMKKRIQVVRQLLIDKKR